jgi:hypothetical protein
MDAAAADAMEEVAAAVVAVEAAVAVGAEVAAGQLKRQG